MDIFPGTDTREIEPLKKKLRSGLMSVSRSSRRSRNELDAQTGMFLWRRGVDSNGETTRTDVPPGMDWLGRGFLSTGGMSLLKVPSSNKFLGTFRKVTEYWTHPVSGLEKPTTLYQRPEQKSFSLVVGTFWEGNMGVEFEGTEPLPNELITIVFGWVRSTSFIIFHNSMAQ